MSQKQVGQNQEHQESKYTDAKPAQKSEHYEDFTVLAERLRKEGRLNEKNYRKIKTTRFFLLSFVFILSIASFFVSKILFFLFLIFLIFLARREGINGLCYLYTFGKRAEGLIVEVRKEFIRNKMFRFFYDVVFEFHDEEKTIKIIQVDEGYNTKFNKSCKVGDRVQILYNPENLHEAIIPDPKRCYFNLLLTQNN